MRGPQPFTQDKGISGTHNSEEFAKTAKDNQIRVVSDSPGITEGTRNIEYQVPKMNSAKEISKSPTGEVLYKQPILKKTTYDPNILPDKKVLEEGKKAALNGYHEAISKNLVEYSQSSNGIKFRIYLDRKTFQITNLYPI